MNRRQFIKGAMACAVSLAIPKVPILDSDAISIEHIVNLGRYLDRASHSHLSSGTYVMFMSDTQFEAVKGLDDFISVEGDASTGTWSGINIIKSGKLNG